MTLEEAAIKLATFWRRNDVYANLREFRDVINGEELNEMDDLVTFILLNSANEDSENIIPNSAE